MGFYKPLWWSTWPSLKYLCSARTHWQLLDIVCHVRIVILYNNVTMPFQRQKLLLFCNWQLIVKKMYYLSLLVLVEAWRNECLLFYSTLFLFLLQYLLQLHASPVSHLSRPERFSGDSGNFVPGPMWATFWVTGALFADGMCNGSLHNLPPHQHSWCMGYGRVIQEFYRLLFSGVIHTLRNLVLWSHYSRSWGSGSPDGSVSR